MIDNPKIKIWFCDWWQKFNVYDNYIIDLFQDKDNIIITNDNPDIVFSVNIGKRHEYKKYKNAIKIQVINSECYFKFNSDEFDYCIGDINLNLEDTEESVYIPFWLQRFFQIKQNNIANLEYNDDQFLNRKFCNFIGKCQDRLYRKDFIDQLSKYKKVDAIIDGPYCESKLPNDQGWISKYFWTQNYKYNICFENANKIGYITEKIIDAIYSKTIPIYFGNKETVLKDFNINEDLLIQSEKDFEKVINKIKYLEDNPNEYLNIVKSFRIKNGIIEKYKENFNQFIKNIIEKKRKTLLTSSSIRNISINDLMAHSVVISINNNQLNAFYKIFTQNELLPLPKKIPGIELSNFGTWTKNGFKTLDSDTFPALGCTMSHISAIQIAKFLNWPFICIFEDDAYPHLNIKNYLNKYLTNIPSCINLLILGNNNFERNKIFLDNRYFGFNLNYGSHAYILFKSGYDEYLKTLKHSNAVADVIFEKLPNSYATSENLFLQFNIEKSKISQTTGLWHRTMSYKQKMKAFPDPSIYNF